MQTSYLYSSYSGLSISTPVVTSKFLSSQIKVIYVFSLSYPHSYQSIPLLFETPGNNSVLLKYATTCVTADRGTAHELRPRLFPHFVVNSLPLWSNPAVMPYKSLGKLSDILHLNNRNKQLERQAWPPRNVPPDAQSWTRASSSSSRVAAVTTATYASQTLAQAPRIGYLMDLPSRSALEGGNELRMDYAI